MAKRKMTLSYGQTLFKPIDMADIRKVETWQSAK